MPDTTLKKGQLQSWITPLPAKQPPWQAAQAGTLRRREESCEYWFAESWIYGTATAQKYT